MWEIFWPSFTIGLVLYAIYKWTTANNDYFLKRNVAFIEPTFFLGTTGGLFLKMHKAHELVMDIYKAFPTEKIYGLFDFRKPLYFVRDPEMVKQLAVKDFDHFENHPMFIDEKTDKLFGNGLFFMQSEKWRDMRATLSPAFTGNKMRQMFELVSDCAADMSAFFKREAVAGKEIHADMKDLFSRYTNDVIASSAFGITVNSFENRENNFYATGKQLMNFRRIKNLIKIFLIRVAPSLMRFFDIQFIDKTAGKYFKSIILDTMDYREKENIYRPDMINIMMQVKKGSLLLKEQQNAAEDKTNDGFATVEESHIGKVVVKRQWTEDEIVAQCFLFFLAGFDTASQALSFISYELAVNPDVQAKLYAEVMETNKRLNGGKLPYDELQKMKYMDMVITETLRRWPPVTVVDRCCEKDYEYDDGKRKFTITKGTSIWIPVYAFQHDPVYFPNPMKFDPERFSDENKDNIVPGTYIPFGVGPRNCIGSRFALMELKAVIYHLLLNFTFEPDARTDIPLKLANAPSGFQPVNGIFLEFKLR